MCDIKKQLLSSDVAVYCLMLCLGDLGICHSGMLETQVRCLSSPSDLTHSQLADLLG